ncbi:MULTISPECIES: hypothetical protein [Paraburkholderia]|uniref:Uncharacterized protein n=1 Tax=Paraburkholderia bryophila TaxID=420952 RepID=A0A329CVB3_9BURK|nr:MULTISPECIES: hypothetical protein [Paraburkholderia]RAS38328.1 hypothetical protein BX591_102626 [Paraburkholderia bryophila]CAE6696766.1 hypothetical protein R75483_00631 [Paraburkholderia domus]
MNNNINTFKKFQDDNQDARAKIIQNYLHLAKKRKLGFPHVTALAEALAEHLSIAEGKPCSKSTLLRNQKYKVKLVGFMAVANITNHKNGKGDGFSGRPEVENFKERLEITNLRRENERLKILYQETERRKEEERNRESEVLLTGGDAERRSIEELQNRHALTCQALHALLTYIEDFVLVDADGERFIDRAKLRNNVIVEHRLASPFFDWLRAHRGILGGKS